MRTLLLTALAWLPLPLTHALGWLVGNLLYVSQSRPRFIANRNLEICFPTLDETGRHRLCRRSLIEFGKTVLESFTLWLAPKSRVLRLVKHVHGGALLEQAMQQQRGAILLVPHLGNWELVGLYCSSLHPMVSMYRPQRSAYLNDLTLSSRQRFGAQLVTSTAEGVRSLLKGLKQNKLIGILPDQNPGAGAGVFMPFFGILTNTPTLPVKLAHKTGAPVIYAYAQRLPWGRGFEIHFHSADPDIGHHHTAHAARVMNVELEHLIKRLPEQYWWSHNRFRHRPAGEDSLY